MYHKSNTKALTENLLKWSNNFDMSTKTINEMHTEFQTALNSAINTHIPVKIIAKHHQTLWINIRIKRLHKRKQRTFNTHKIHRNHARHNQIVRHAKMRNE